MPAADPVTRLLPRDYIVTADGLYFAVLLHGTTAQPVHAQLRYVHDAGSLKKMDSREAYEYLKEFHPGTLAYSETLDTETIMVPPEEIWEIRRPVDVPGRIEAAPENDNLKQIAVEAIRILVNHGVRRESLGITGSLMLDFHDTGSDIDLVVYDPAAFRLARQVIQECFSSGELMPLDENTWLETWRRRNCALDFDVYLKHEKRKFNKCMLGESKIDLSCIPIQPVQDINPPVRKLGQTSIKAMVVDDDRAFDYPACFIVDDNETTKILCYTATYTGQAFRGETIEATGMVECDADGNRYMVIGTSREAPGEYLKVIDI